MNISSIFQFILGFILGVIILAGGSVAVGYLLLTKMTSNPDKPIFPEEQVKPKTTASKEPKSTPEVKPTETPKPSPSPSPSPEEKKDELEPGAYKARVTWSSGLSVRAEPTTEASRVGGVDYNAEIIILKESDDKQWQKIRIVATDQEGWVKSGNTERIESESESESQE